MAHLGGEKAFRKARRRDKTKATLCKAKGLQLLCIHEADELKESAIRFAVHKVIPSLPIVSPQKLESPPYDFFIRSDGITSRWTNHSDKGELSISVDGRELSFHISGTDYTITIRHEGETVKSIRVWMQRTSGSASFTLPVNQAEQMVDLRPNPRKILELFRVWATFDSNIGFEEEKAGELPVKLPVSEG
ncbi:MAG: hypothetical protein AB1813_09245 [Verrucomicrobiota bacterium]